MDIAYNQHSPYSRHQGRSQTNLNHLTLAPLTSRLPLSDHDDALPETASYSYIEGRSAPTTPSILSRSSSRVSLRRHKPTNLSLTKSKSSTHLVAANQSRSGISTPGGTRLRKIRDELNISAFSESNRNDSDWLLRAGATISYSARESKGQAWLVSRQSSTSLTAERDAVDEEYGQEMARERARSARASRRGSIAGGFDADDEFSPVTTRRSLSFGPHTSSQPISRFSSRVNSRSGSKSFPLTPMGLDKEGYFDHKDFADQFIAEPDFVDDEEDGLEDEDDAKNDEAVVKKLASASGVGLAGWVERMLGWNLFAVDEDAEETETEFTDDKTEDSEISSITSKRNLRARSDTLTEESMPLVREDEADGWQDAAWLLSVATKVLL